MKGLIRPFGVLISIPRAMRASPGALVVRNLPMQEMDAGSIPVLEDPLEQEIATLSRSLAWRVSWTEDPVGL